MWGVRLPVSPASLSKIPHDQAQGRGRPGVCVPDLRETVREGAQPERAHVYGAPADSGRGSERQQPTTATVWLAEHHADWRSAPPGPGEVTAGGLNMRPSLRLFWQRGKDFSLLAHTRLLSCVCGFGVVVWQREMNRLVLELEHKDAFCRVSKSVSLATNTKSCWVVSAADRTHFFCIAKVIFILLQLGFKIYFIYSWTGCFCSHECFTLELLDLRLRKSGDD